MQGVVDALFKNNQNPKYQTISQIVGAATLGGGLYGALTQKPKSFYEATKDTQLAINAIQPAFEQKAEGIEAGVNADLATYGQQAQARTQQGLEARGITDAAVGREAQAKTTQGLSGAYAAAASALSQAKINANQRLSGTLSSYYQNMASAQYKSLMDKYYGKMGIYGAIGGIGGAILNRKNQNEGEE